MVLTNEQLRATLSGAAEIIEKNGVLAPLRFGRYLREKVYPAGNRFNPKMTQSAGIVCRFTTIEGGTRRSLWGKPLCPFKERERASLSPSNRLRGV